MSKVESYLLGMDCGTTNLKAIILGEDGTVVAEASRPHFGVLCRLGYVFCVKPG